MVNIAEDYVSNLCNRSFLSLWSYPNLYIDKGRNGDKGDGKELCDFLVVFKNSVIIFSIKAIEFKKSSSIEVSWNRWFKRAVIKSAKQVFGAERWLREFPSKVFTDRSCKIAFPIPIPEPDELEVHRICIAFGCYQACKEHFGGGSLGSLVIDSGLNGVSDHISPFCVGNIDPSHGFIHVFEELTFTEALRELDTITDFLNYLRKRETLLSNRPVIRAPGDEQLLSIYLTHLNGDGEHDFVFPTSSEAPDLIMLEEDFWDSLKTNRQYIAKKAADKISYAWDKLINVFIEEGGVIEDGNWRKHKPNDNEAALRILASESRFGRRSMATAFLELLAKTKDGNDRARAVQSLDNPNTKYVFFVCQRREDEPYQQYRQRRTDALAAYVWASKAISAETEFIIGLATESQTGKGSSQDLIFLNASNWTDQNQIAAEEIRRTAGLWQEGRIELIHHSDQEWPKLARDASSSNRSQPSKKSKSNNKELRKSKRNLQKKSRKRNRRK